MFHPFVPRPYLASAASAVAEFVENHNIEPFSITLDNLVILPDLEAYEESITNQEANIQIHKEKEEALTDVQKLILNEERAGKERYMKRMKKKKKDRKQSKRQGTESNPTTFARGNVKDFSTSKEKNNYNGPCIIYLQPNEESTAKLIQIRQTLKNELFSPYEAYSMASTLSLSDYLPNSEMMLDNEKFEHSYQPCIALGTFPTTDAAIKVARKLQNLWEPLTFNVTDFHFISLEYSNDSSPQQDTTTNNKELNSMSTAQYECDAMVMLMGEELDSNTNMLDDTESEDLLSLIFQAGEEGGGAANVDYKEISPEEKRWREERSAILKSMLNDENDYDGEDDDLDRINKMEEFWFDDDDDDLNGEGATIVIGRSQFFLGEMRLYVG